MLQPSNIKLTQLERIFEMRTGKQYLESLRDGRKVYVGGEIIEDVTTHPMTKGYANAIAEYYDLHLKPENEERCTFIDRKSVVSGKSVSVRVDIGGRRIINKKK